MKNVIRTLQLSYLRWQVQRHRDRGEERQYLLAMQQLRTLTQKTGGHKNA